MAFEGFTNEGAVVSIGTTTEASDLTDFENDSYTAIGTLETKPEVGVSSNVVTANPLVGDEIARKGSRTFPETTLELLFEPGSAGLSALQTAEEDSDPYNFEIEYGDAPDASGGNGTTHYFRALVTSLTYPSGGVDDFARVNVGLKLVSRVTEKDASS